MDKKFSVMRTVSDNAVIQSGCENVICGTAPVGETVLLTIKRLGNKYDFSGKADNCGKWQIKIPPFESAVNGCLFDFFCGGEKKSFGKIVFGELFHISGQSNMELPLSRTYSPFVKQEFEYTDLVREFRVPIKPCFGKDEVYEDFQGGEWKTAQKENILSMSAAGYWFALEIAQKYKIPVGLLNTSAGGSPVEARMPYSMLSAEGDYDDFLEKCTKDDYVEDCLRSDKIKNDKRYAEIDAQDKISEKMLRGDYSGIAFEKCSVPFYFRELPSLDGLSGIVWFRKEFEIPEDVDISDGELILGTIIDADHAYLNGVPVGVTWYMYPPRYYKLPAGAAVHGKNTLLVKLDVKDGKGGFVRDKRYCFKFGETIIDISGEWEYAAAAKVPPVEPDVFFQGLPLSMYGAMTAPAFRIKCRAMLWYQGESNDRNPERYSYLFEKFVNMYRERCGYEIPVIFTQLCNFDDPTGVVAENAWAVIRNEQLKCMKIPAAAMAVTVDIGESNDLHPKNKKDVGHRLALCARKMLFGDKSVPDDIFCTSADFSVDGKITLGFTGGSPILKNGDSSAFEVIYENGEKSNVSAEESGGKIVLEYDPAKKPVLVRYAWANDPEIVLYRSDGIPISPFEIKLN